MSSFLHLTNQAKSTRTMFPIIIHGRIIGTAAITGDPVIIKDVIGATAETIIPLTIPQYNVSIISIRLINPPIT